MLQLDVAGQLGSAPVGSTPVGSTSPPVGSTPVGSTPVGSTDIPASLLANIPLADIANDDHDLPAVVNCSGTFVCTGKTLGNAYTARAILTTATFNQIKNAMAAHGITIDDVLIAVLGAAGLPWEQLPLQGLQPYSQTKSTSTTRSAPASTARPCPSSPSPPACRGASSRRTARRSSPSEPIRRRTPACRRCSAATRPRPPSSTLTGGRSCPSGDNNTETATLTFDAWVGLKLGTFTTRADAATGSYSVSTTGAPVTVHQNSEAQDPSNATEIQPDRLVAGHIAFGGEQAFYKVNLTAFRAGRRLRRSSTSRRTPTSTSR